MGARCAGQKPQQTPPWSQTAAPLEVGFRAELGEQGPCEGRSHWLPEAKPWLVWVLPSGDWVRSDGLVPQASAASALHPPGP